MARLAYETVRETMRRRGSEWRRHKAGHGGCHTDLRLFFEMESPYPLHRFPGLFTTDGQWIPVPDVDAHKAELLFRHKILRLLHDHELVSQERMNLLLFWRHSGFSVHNRTTVYPSDTEGLHKLACYLMGRQAPVVRAGATNAASTTRAVGAIGVFALRRVVIVNADTLARWHRERFRAVDAERGGEPEIVTTLDAGRKEATHRWPAFLPDGERFLFFVRSAVEGNEGLYLGALAGAEPQFLVAADSSAVYASPGYLLYIRDGSLVAHPFDAARGAPAGAPTVLPQTAELTRFSRAALSVSDGGTLLLSDGQELQQLTLLDREGRKIGDVGAPGMTPSFSLSPDGELVAYSRAALTRRGDLWVLRTDESVPTRLTQNPATDWAPMWSIDGKQLFFHSNRTEAQSLYVMDLALREPERPLLEGTVAVVSADGRFAIGNRDGDVWVLPLNAADEPVLLLEGEQVFWDSADLSPDDRWLAYVSEQTGRQEIYVVSVPQSGRPLPVSRAGGRLPRWRGDGRELFYVDEGHRLISVTAGSGEGVLGGAPRALFALGGDLVYDVSPDGERFLVNVPLDEPERLKLYFDWSSYLPD